MALNIIVADLENPRHCEAIRFLINAYATDPMGGGMPIDPAILAQIIPGLRANPTTLVLLAFDNESPVGIANCFLGFSTFAAKPLLNIHDLAVLPERRGEGIGRKLLEGAQARGEELGCCKLTLEVRQDNHRARKIYEEFGFGNFTTGQQETPTFFLQKVLRKEGE